MGSTRGEISCFSGSRGIELVWRDGFIAFKSREHVYNQIKETLMDEKGDKHLGVIGMGGIGKTKLVTEIGKNVKDANLFDEVLMVAVSRDPNIRRIQGVLADMLDLQLKGCSETDRARELNARLSRAKRYLIILDDVWEQLDLIQIGIPSGDHCQGSKILITSRREEACIEMKCRRRVHLGVMADDEAMYLFRIYAALDTRSELNDLAITVVKKCHGLPLAVIAVGSALKWTGSGRYKQAIERLSNSNYVDVESADVEIYSCLKLSYDYLDSDETRKLFLLCSLFLEDSNIEVENLTRYAIGCGLFDSEAVSIQEARQRTFSCIEKLGHASLLSSPHQAPNSVSNYNNGPNYCIESEQQFGVKRHSVTMHDMVRDVALWITKTETGGFYLVLRPQELCPPWRYRCQNVGALSVNVLNHGDFPTELRCPTLKILRLKQVFPKSQDTVFKYMENLEVLDFSRFSIVKDGPSPLQSVHLPQLYLLPLSLQDLHYLKTLHLCNWTNVSLCDISIIGNLKNLEILSFRDSYIEGLSEEISQLSKLRVLDLTNCKSFRWIPQNLLPRFTQLEELYTFSRDIHLGGWGGDGKARLSELRFLPHLSAFTAWLPSNQAYNRCLSSYCEGRQSQPRNFVFKELQCYTINTLPESYPTAFKFPLNLMGLTQSLVLHDLHIESKVVLQELLEKVMLIAIYGPMKHFMNVFPQIGDKGFGNITQLVLTHSVNLECLVYTLGLFPPKPVFPSLVRLVMENMPKLAKMCQGPTPPDFLKHLKEAWFSSCPMLQNIFPSMLPIGSELDALHYLHISNCPHMIYVFDLEPLLKVEEGTSTRLFSCSTKLILSNLPELLSIWKLPKAMETSDKLDKELYTMIVEAYLGSLNSLVDLTMENCDQVKEIFQLHYVKDSLCGEQLSNLVELKLRDLLLLECIWKEPVECYSLKNLEKIEIVRCHKLRILFTHSIAQALCKLRCIIIVECNGLERLISDNWSGEDIRLPELRKIDIQACNILKFLLPVSVAAEQGFPKLEIISIENCAQLRYIFGYGLEIVEWSRTITLSNLHTLKLMKLPSLINMSQVNYQVLVASLCEVKVDDWRKFNFQNVPSEQQSQDIRLWVKDKTRLQLLSLIKIKAITMGFFRLILHTPFLDWGWQGISEAIQLILRLVAINTMIGGYYKIISYVPFLEWGMQEVTETDQLLLWSVILRGMILGCSKILGQNTVSDWALRTVNEAGQLQLIRSVLMAIFWGCFGLVLKRYFAFLSQEQISRSTQEQLQDLVNLRAITLHDSETVEELINGASLASQGHQQLIAMKLMSLDLASLPALTHIWKGPAHTLSFRYLNNLVISDCQLLKNIFTPSTAATLVELKNIKICSCVNLESIITNDCVGDIFDDGTANPTCFQKLKQIRIFSCDQLKSILPISVVRGCQRLEVLIIHGCSKLENVFTDVHQGKEDIKLEIKLSSLMGLHLTGLSSLKYFAPAKYYFTCPELMTLSIRYRYMGENMSDIAEDPIAIAVLEDIADKQQSLNTLLDQVQQRELCWEILEEAQRSIGEAVDQGIFNGLLPFKMGGPSFKPFLWNEVLPGFRQGPLPWNSNVAHHLNIENSTVETIFEIDDAETEDWLPFLALELLFLNNLPNLECIWKSPPMLVVNAGRLASVEIRDCAALKTLFTYNVARTLTCLKSLELSNCKLLENVIEPYVRSSIYAPSKVAYLPNLEVLAVTNCERLKTVFPLSLSEHLLSLNLLVIIGASQLRQIFFEDREEGCERQYAVCAGKLQFVKLHRLPSLTSLCPPAYVLYSHQVVEMDIDDCPLLNYTNTRGHTGFQTQILTPP